MPTRIGKAAPPGSTIGIVTPGSPAESRAEVQDVLSGRVGHLGVPILYGLPIGHGATLSTLPRGVQATVDANALTLTIDEPALAT